MNKILKRKFTFLNSKIGLKLISILIALSLIPITTLGIISYENSEKVIKKRFEITTIQTINEINRGLSNYFDGLQRQINVMSSNVDFQEIYHKSEYEPFLMDLLRNFQENNADISSIYLGTTTKKFYNYPKDNIGENFDPTTRPWYTEATQNKGKLIITKFYKHATNGQPMVTIAKTVESNGQIVGVVAMDLNLNILSEKLSNSNVGQNGYVIIASTEGLVLAHPDKSMVGTDGITKMSYWKNVSTNDNGFEKYIYNGLDKYTSYVTNKESGWKIIAAVESSELMDDIKIIRNITILCILVAGIVSILIAILLSRWISNNITKLKTQFKKASEGDLTAVVNITSKDEFRDLGTSFNDMIRNINTLLISVKNSSNLVQNTSKLIFDMSEETNKSVQEVASAIDAVASGAVSQTSDIEEGVQKFDAFSTKIDNIVQLTSNMSEISHNANLVSNEGLDVVDILLNKTNITSKITFEVSSVVLDMNTAIDEIGLITETINQISDQTNLLALNAAIEAARAGEYGRGFAVVATEVRKLAEGTAEATKEIQQLIEKISTKSKKAVTVMKSAESTIADQNSSVENTRIIFGKIINSISELIVELQKIETSVSETNLSKDEIITIMHNISAVSEETAASSEEVSSSTEEIELTMTKFINNANTLKEISLKLYSEINTFKLNY